MISGIHSYAGVTDNTGSGLKKLMVALGIGKEDKTPADKDAFDSATLTEKVNYIASKLDESGAVGGKDSGVESRIGFSTKEARQALEEKGFALISKQKGWSGEEIYAYVKKEKVCSVPWEEADFIAQNYYREVNDWSASQGYGCIAFQSRLPSKVDAEEGLIFKMLGEVPNNYWSFSRSKDEPWLSSKGDAEYTHLVYSPHLTNGQIDEMNRYYSKGGVDYSEHGVYPIILTRDGENSEKMAKEDSYMAGSGVNITSDEIRESLAEKGLIKITERTALNGKKLYGFW